MSIDTVLDKSRTEILEVSSPQSGDCGSVAKAIKNVFGGELVGMYESLDDTLPSHVVVRIDGNLYDNEGTTSKYELAENIFIMRNDSTNFDMSNLDEHFISEEQRPIHDAMFEDDTIQSVQTIIRKNRSKS